MYDALGDLSAQVPRLACRIALVRFALCRACETARARKSVRAHARSTASRIARLSSSSVVVQTVVDVGSRTGGVLFVGYLYRCVRFRCVRRPRPMLQNALAPAPHLRRD